MAEFSIDTVLRSLLEIAETGGPVVVILALLSVAGLTIIHAKVWQFYVAGIGNRRPVEDALWLLRQGHPHDALTVLQPLKSPLAQALAQAIRGQIRGVPEAKVREELQAYCQENLSGLRGWLKSLEVIAALAPLLGLLGTVLGMIEAFRQLEAAGTQVNPAILSGGIWEALLTTAIGLAVAIPAVIASNWLEQRVDRLAQDMEAFVPRAFTVDLTDETSGAGEQTKPNLRYAGED